MQADLWHQQGQPIGVQIAMILVGAEALSL
jgi:hypothetical protein